MLAGSPSEVIDGVEAVRAVAEDCALVKPRRVNGRESNSCEEHDDNTK